MLYLLTIKNKQYDHLILFIDYLRIMFCEEGFDSVVSKNRVIKVLLS